MAFCENCGAKLDANSTFCANCGRPVRPASANDLPVMSAPAAGECPPKGSPYAVLGAWSFLGSLLLMSLPVVGFLFTIIWACAAHNRNRRNLARAMLLMILICFILTAISAYLLYTYYGYMPDSLADFAVM